MTQDHLQTTVPEADFSSEAVIRNKRGLHARASARFVKLAGNFSAQITVCRKDTCVPGVSIMGLMMLAASPGTTLRISASGADAREAVEALCQLVDDKFDEE
ncbi:HPr family phosphocarrier protein [Kiloniella sp. b19]|uniref:HPr family phosphocarrier protein n=1 Tax=Kiloniella sp. GXU_MW_B19 TaxID=3141326 RepID=UPI0031CE4307